MLQHAKIRSNADRVNNLGTTATAARQPTLHMGVTPTIAAQPTSSRVIHVLLFHRSLHTHDYIE